MLEFWLAFQRMTGGPSKSALKPTTMNAASPYWVARRILPLRREVGFRRNRTDTVCCGSFGFPHHGPCSTSHVRSILVHCRLNLRTTSALTQNFSYRSLMSSRLTSWSPISIPSSSSSHVRTRVKSKTLLRHVPLLWVGCRLPIPATSRRNRIRHDPCQRHQRRLRPKHERRFRRNRRQRQQSLLSPYSASLQYPAKNGWAVKGSVCAYGGRTG